MTARGGSSRRCTVDGGRRLRVHGRRSWRGRRQQRVSRGRARWDRWPATGSSGWSRARGWPGTRARALAGGAAGPTATALPVPSARDHGDHAPEHSGGDTSPETLTRTGAGARGRPGEHAVERAARRSTTGSRSFQTSQRGARRTPRLEDRVDGAPRGLVGALHRGEVGVRAHEVGREEEVRARVTASGRSAHEPAGVDQQRLEVGRARSGWGTGSPGRGTRRARWRRRARRRRCGPSWPQTSVRISSGVHFAATLPYAARAAPIRDVDREDPLDAPVAVRSRSTRARTAPARSPSAPTPSR